MNLALYLVKFMPKLFACELLSPSRIKYHIDGVI